MHFPLHSRQLSGKHLDQSRQMRNGGAEKFYPSLSRKQLQSLCKKYGLPAKKTTSQMAKSLASYLEKNLSSRPFGEMLGGTQKNLLPSFKIPELQPGAPFNFLEDATKDSLGLNSCSREEGNRRKCSQPVISKELGHCMGDIVCDKESLGCSMCCLQETSNFQFLSECDRSSFHRKESPKAFLSKNYSGIARDGGVEDMRQIQYGDVNLGSHPKENAFTSSMKTFKTASSSSFEFYVRSEEGIGLCVDLNSTPSDWIKKLKSEVSFCENMCHNKPLSFRQELGRFGEINKLVKGSFLWNIDAPKIKNVHVQDDSSRMRPKNGEVQDLVDSNGNTETKQGGLADSSEPDVDICRNHFPTSVARGRSKLIDGWEGSECSQLDDSSKKTCSKLDNVESNEKICKKRAHINSKDQYCHGKSDARILRSTKRPRRSMRLVPKGIFFKENTSVPRGGRSWSSPPMGGRHVSISGVGAIR